MIHSVSIKRITDFLNLEEVDPNLVEHDIPSGSKPTSKLLRTNITFAPILSSKTSSAKTDFFNTSTKAGFPATLASNTFEEESILIN